VRFRAIGSNPTEEMLALASDRLVIDGFIDDLGPVLSKARVMLVPLRYGAGLKGKIVTAMAHGLPVVTTSVGAEGMALTHGENVLVADTPQDMAAAVARLYTDEMLWKRLSAAGLAFVAATTSREEGLRITRQILEHASLPALPYRAATLDVTVHDAPIGTPAALQDADVLADAARKALGLQPDAVISLLLPQDPARLSPPHDGTTVHLHSLGASLPAPTGHAVLVVDAFDDAALGNALALSASARPMAVLFLPPCMTAGPKGYGLSHALSGALLKAGQARQPVHLRHAAALSALGRPLHWQADTSVTGFAGMTILTLG
jgi:hypothetical protein